MTQPLALPCHTILPELENYNGSPRAFVEDRGWRYLSNGAYTHVYLSPTGDRVIKITDSDEGAEATLRAALSNPDNPHLPNVYGYTELPWGGFAVEMERLEAVGHQFYEWSSTYGCRRSAPDLDAMPEGPMKDALAALVAEAEQCENFLQWDDHSGNVMVRPETGELVLTDLLADWGEKHHCDRCAEVIPAENACAVGDDGLWCDTCAGEHAVQCRECGCRHADDAPEAPLRFIEIFQAWEGAHPRFIEDHICEDCGTHEDGAIEVVNGDDKAIIGPNLAAVLKAIEDIAQETQHHQLSLPLALAA